MFKTKKILLLLLLALYVTYYASTILFLHTHIIDGTLTAHSHMHKESHHNSKSEGHTKQELICIAHNSHFEFIISSCNNSLAPHQIQLRENKITETTHHLDSEYFQNLSLRALPV